MSSRTTTAEIGVYGSTTLMECELSSYHSRLEEIGSPSVALAVESVSDEKGKYADTGSAVADDIDAMCGHPLNEQQFTTASEEGTVGFAHVIVEPSPRDAPSELVEVSDAHTEIFSTPSASSIMAAATSGKLDDGNSQSLAYVLRIPQLMPYAVRARRGTGNHLAAVRLGALQ